MNGGQRKYSLKLNLFINDIIEEFLKCNNKDYIRMLEKLKNQPEDKIMALMALFKADLREQKIDLGVGVYKNEEGLTPIMSAVSEAIDILTNSQETKSYVGLLGNLSFLDQIGDLVFGQDFSKDRLAGAQAPGGTGAIHQILLTIRSLNLSSKVWISLPSWPNHEAILRHLSFNYEKYIYFDPITCSVDFDRMMHDLRSIQEGDILLLHGCCHNPTGANLTIKEWRELTELCSKKRVVPLIDLAYQGFGDGLDQDVEGLRYMVANLPESCVAISCSKNFGLYRERVGASFIITDNKKNKQLAEDNLKSFNRLTFSFPPDFGASVVDIILSDIVSDKTSPTTLKNTWKTELEEMRLRMQNIRESLAASLKAHTKSERFEFVGTHRGMFSLLGLEPNEIKRLREDYGIYMVADSRVNIAGLSQNKIEKFALAVSSII